MLFDFATISPQDRYKLLVSTVVPRPIAWVVTQDPQGRLNAAPFSFFNAFSQDPPMVIIGIGGRQPGDAKDTGRNIRETGEFVVNLVGHANLRADEHHRHRVSARSRRNRRGRADHRCRASRSSRRASPKARWRWNAGGSC